MQPKALLRPGRDLLRARKPPAMSCCYVGWPADWAPTQVFALLLPQAQS